MLVTWSQRENQIDEIWKSPPFVSFRLLLRRGRIDFPEHKGQELLLCCLNGSATIRLPQQDLEFEIMSKDMCHVQPARNAVDLEGEDCFLTLHQGKSKAIFDPYVRRFEQVRGEIRGEEGYRRTVFTSVGPTDPGWLLAGFTEGFKGEWTSYPPHRHNDKLEVYVYYGLGSSYGIQIIEDDAALKTYPVKNWDAVYIARGYHPNVSTPDRGINYLWVIYPLADRTLKVDEKPRDR